MNFYLLIRRSFFPYRHKPILRQTRYSKATAFPAAASHNSRFFPAVSFLMVISRFSASLLERSSETIRIAVGLFRRVYFAPLPARWAAEPLLRAVAECRSKARRFHTESGKRAKFSAFHASASLAKLSVKIRTAASVLADWTR